MESDGHIQADGLGVGFGWINIVSHLVKVSGCRHHSAPKLVPHYHVLTCPILFHPKEFLSTFEIAFWIT